MIIKTLPFIVLTGLLQIFCTAQETLPPSPLLPVPSMEQLAWHQMEMNAFIHFSINTFTDKEWGYGDESPALFNPTAADPGQWASELKKAGFRGIILTAKHHDGFCLWPSGYTEHSVKNSPHKSGKGDILQELSGACKKSGLKMGIYVSPWDRNHAGYGKPEYITYYRQQMQELITRYGPFFEIWFDGANGGDGYYGGAREKRDIDGKRYYKWPGTIAAINTINPGAIFFSDAGPGCRWTGNEEGKAGETNWNTITTDTLYAGKPNITALLNTGSENGKQWVPAECDVSIRPGWFWHAGEDQKVKTPEQLFDIYLASVGRGSVLLLNVPPDRRGLLNEADLKSLRGFRAILDREFSKELSAGRAITASNIRGNDRRFAPENLSDGNPESYWATDDGIRTGSFEVDFGSAKSVKYIVLQEYIRLGQRVRSFRVEGLEGDQWKTLASGTTIGYKRILKIDPATVTRMRILITDSKACPVISALAVY
jgi:alpha-L-fucosidase